MSAPKASVGGLWANEAFAPGESVEVTDVKDLTLLVRRRQMRKQGDGEMP